jgi:hypothetical protein
VRRSRQIHFVFGSGAVVIAASIPLVPLRGYALGASVALSATLVGWFCYAVRHRRGPAEDARAVRNHESDHDGG